MRGSASASVDVSDGLARDAWHVAEASGVGLVFEENALRARASASLDAAAALLGRDVLGLVLEGGEDYALHVASASSSLPGFDRVGRVEAAKAALILERADGARTPIDPRGFDHFG